MPAIHLRELAKVYADRCVGLAPTTLSIPAGAYFVLLGPSGSGKSTLLRLIAGLEDPTGGTIYFEDRRIDELPPHERGLTLVPQRTVLFPDRNVAGNIRIGLQLFESRLPAGQRTRSAVLEERVHEAADLLGIASHLAKWPGELSGGEQRRVMLARALVRRAPIWLLDEPLSQLDAPLAEKLSRDLHLLHERFALTIIQVTHDPNEAMALADRVGLLGEGRLLQTGTPEEVYTRPGSRTVGLHFGRPSIALLDGRAERGEFQSGWLRIPFARSGPVTLGLRAEDVRFDPTPGWLDSGLACVSGCRRLDARYLVELAGGLRGLATSPLANETKVWVNPARLHWFDVVTGERIPDELHE